MSDYQGVIRDTQRNLEMFEFVAKHAEDLGFASYWVPDHIILPLNYSTPYPGKPRGGAVLRQEGDPCGTNRSHPQLPCTNLPHAGGIGQAIVQTLADTLLLFAIWKRTGSVWVALATMILVVTAAYDVALAPLSVGIACHAYAIRAAIDEGLRTYDFLRGGEPYKYDLGGSDHWLLRLEASRP